MVGISGVGENFDPYVEKMDGLRRLSRARQRVECRLEDPSLSDGQRRKLEVKLERIREQERAKVKKMT